MNEEHIKTLFDDLEEKSEILDKLYPPLPEDYFDGMDLDAIMAPSEKSKPKIRPFINISFDDKHRRKDDSSNDKLSPKIVIGIKGEF